MLQFNWNSNLCLLRMGKLSIIDWAYVKILYLRERRSISSRPPLCLPRCCNRSSVFILFADAAPWFGDSGKLSVFQFLPFYAGMIFLSWVPNFFGGLSEAWRLKEMGIIRLVFCIANTDTGLTQFDSKLAKFCFFGRYDVAALFCRLFFLFYNLFSSRFDIDL